MNCRSRLSSRAKLARLFSIFTMARSTSNRRPDQTIASRSRKQTQSQTKLLFQRLLREFPDDGILAEESIDTAHRLDKPRVWMIDPLDGTTGFIDGNGDFAVQIGLTEHGRCVLGVVYQPLTGVLYRAVRGGGCWIERPEFEPARAQRF